MVKTRGNHAGKMALEYLYIPVVLVIGRPIFALIHKYTRRESLFFNDNFVHHCLAKSAFVGLLDQQAMR